MKEKPLEQAVQEAKHVIAEAAGEATRVIAQAAQAAQIVQSKISSEDHDLLIELKTKMIDLKADIRDIKDGVSVKIDNIEKCMLCLPTEYVAKDDFTFWRNILAGSMIATIFVAVILRFVVK